MASPPIIDDPSQASRRAKMRVAVAAVLLLTAVGILAVLNQRTPVPEENTEQTTPVQESISSTEAEPAMTEPATTPPVAPTANTSETSAMSPAVPETPPPPPVPGKLPPAPPTPKNTAPVPDVEGASAKSAKVLSPAPTATNEGLSRLGPKTPTTPKAFEVQIGVFTDMDNAKQLQAKLAEYGIPSHTETRVQVGPFKSRAEADQAREKLKAIGIPSVIVTK